MPIVHRLEHFSVDWPKERARRQYEQYGEREATQGKSLKNALSQRLFNFSHRKGQGAQKKCWTVRRMEMNNVAVQRCKFEFNHIFFVQAEDGIRDDLVTGVQTCALPICDRGGQCRADRSGRETLNGRARG